MDIERGKKQLINAVRIYLKHSPVVQAMFEYYNIPLEKIHDVRISFGDLDVSAKTKNKEITINESFLVDGFEEDMHYVVHELVHYLQQHTGDVKGYEDLGSQDYLDKPTEVEAFSYQVQFMRDQYGDEKAEEYVEDFAFDLEMFGKINDKNIFKLIEFYEKGDFEVRQDF